MYIAEERAKIGEGNISAHIFTFRTYCAATQNFNPDFLMGEGGVWACLKRAHWKLKSSMLSQNLSREYVGTFMEDRFLFQFHVLCIRM